MIFLIFLNQICIFTMFVFAGGMMNVAGGFVTHAGTTAPG
jgi:hypothetical protein